MSASAQLDASCAQCNTPFTPEDAVVACSACGAKQHRACWKEGQSCTTPGCLGSPPSSIFTPFRSPAVCAVRAVARQPVSLEDNDSTLVICEGVAFPPVCIITGKQDDLVKLKRKVLYAPTWVMVIILLNPLIGAIAYGLQVKSGQVEFYMQRAYMRTRAKYLFGNWLLGFICLTGWMMAIAHGYFGLSYLLMIATFFAPWAVYGTWIQPYTVVDINNGVIKFKFSQSEQAKAIYDAYRAQ